MDIPPLKEIRTLSLQQESRHSQPAAILYRFLLALHARARARQWLCASLCSPAAVLVARSP